MRRPRSVVARNAGVQASESTCSAPVAVSARSRRLTSGPSPPLVHEHQSLAALGELVGELHDDAASERLADECRAVVTEGVQQVAKHCGVGAERVLAARLGRFAVPEQIRGDDRDTASASPA